MRIVVRRMRCGIPDHPNLIASHSANECHSTNLKIRNMKTKSKMIAVVVLVALVWIYSAGWMIGNALARSEKAECIKWEKWSHEYPNWYAVNWQVQQCEQHAININ